MEFYLVFGAVIALGIAALVYFDSKGFSEQPSQDPSESGKEAEKGDSEPEIHCSVVAYDNKTNTILLMKQFKDGSIVCFGDQVLNYRVSNKALATIDSLLFNASKHGQIVLEYIEGDFDSL